MCCPAASRAGCGQKDVAQTAQSYVEHFTSSAPTTGRITVSSDGCMWGSPISKWIQPSDYVCKPLTGLFGPIICFDQPWIGTPGGWNGLATDGPHTGHSYLLFKDSYTWETFLSSLVQCSRQNKDQLLYLSWSSLVQNMKSLSFSAAVFCFVLLQTQEIQTIQHAFLEDVLH